MTENSYLDVFGRRNWTNWLWALAGALGLNVALFALMPHLQHPAQARPAFDQPLANINDPDQAARQPGPEKNPKAARSTPTQAVAPAHHDTTPAGPAQPAF